MTSTRFVELQPSGLPCVKNIMLRIFAIAVFVFIPITNAIAEEPEIRARVGAYAQGEAPPIPPPPNAGALLGKVSSELSKNDIFKAGAWLVRVYDRLISVKPGFIRGSSLNNVYAANPVALISDITEFDSDKALVYNYAFPGRAGCYPTVSGEFYFEFAKEKLTLAKCTNGRPDYSFKETIEYKQWLQIWAQNAAKHCGTAVKDYCLIPQVLEGKERHNEINYWVSRFGFVVSSGSPLSRNGLPADFVARGMRSENAGVASLVPDSPLLKLIFQPSVSPWWLVYEIKQDPFLNASADRIYFPETQGIADNVKKTIQSKDLLKMVHIEEPAAENLEYWQP